MKVCTKFNVLLSNEERIAYEQLMAVNFEDDPRDTLLTILLMSMVEGEDNIMQLRKYRQQALTTKFGRVVIPALGLDARIKEFETEWIEKHARLKTAINTVLDTYLQGETK